MTPDQVDGQLIERLARDVIESLALLGESAERLRHVDEAAHAANVVGFLEAIGLRAAQLDERVARLAPYTAALLTEVAADLSDAAEALATRWDGLVASRRSALVDVLLTRKAELTAILTALGRAATADQPAAPRPKSALTVKDAAKAWDAWTLDPSRASADVFLRLSQSWIEGTSAQLARDERSPASASSSATDVMVRLRHHLVLLADAAPIPYMEALATARHRVIAEMHDVGPPAKKAAGRRPAPPGDPR